MKIKFKVQSYQTEAVNSVVSCFAQQPKIAPTNYRLDPGSGESSSGQQIMSYDAQDGFRNADLMIPDHQLLRNIQSIQSLNNLPISKDINPSKSCRINLEVEMETGTGKTYCYIKTIFELHRRYGWSKFIIVVPSVAIREGVYKSLEMTKEHFSQEYHNKARFFIYNSNNLHDVESFSSDSGINIMIINKQAFTGRDNRKINEELEDFNYRRPIDVISANRPILILDEPQNLDGPKTVEGLASFRPLLIIRYSATHRKFHNLVHRLDALDAYNQKLVKKINARGISVKGLDGTNPYIYLESIEISKKAPVSLIEFLAKQNSGTKRLRRKCRTGDNLYDLSGGLEVYKGFVVSEIDARAEFIEFTNGHKLEAGDATGDVTEEAFRRIQIRETIKAHFEKEQKLFSQGIKVLSLFFIDEVAKYRDYSQADEKGEYARIFEEEYEALRQEFLSELLTENHEYRKYLEQIDAGKTHNGYFAIDKKSKRLTDPSFKTRGEEAGISDDVDAYDLILKDKEKLLSFEEPTRFIFSHSALREGWDNPNVFVMCMLKHSENTISRRQEVGRGLRLAVNQHGDRQDHPATVHEINVLSVIANESYKEFVSHLQKETIAALKERPKKADTDYFTGKKMETEAGLVEVSEVMAKQIYRYLVKNDYTRDDDSIAPAYHEAKASESLAPLPDELAPYAQEVFKLVDSVFSESQLPKVGDDRKPKINHLNDNFHKQEFKKLWERINRKAVYQVDFDSNELIGNCVRVMDKELRVTPLQYTIQAGMQGDSVTYEQLGAGKGFELSETKTVREELSVHSTVKYDLIGKLAEGTKLTRRTVAAILTKIQPSVFNQFKQNPEHFIAEATRLINEQKASIIIERLSYDTTNETYDTDVFTDAQTGQDLSQAVGVLKKHVFDYVVTDSKVEREFVEELDSSKEVVVYSKLPRGFLIPTPVGDYNPDWAIAFQEGSVKHVYFVAETKGSLSSLSLRGIEERKIECARKFFERLSGNVDGEKVKYDVVTNYEELMSMVAG